MPQCLASQISFVFSYPFLQVSVVPGKCPIFPEFVVVIKVGCAYYWMMQDLKGLRGHGTLNQGFCDFTYFYDYFMKLVRMDVCGGWCLLKHGQLFSNYLILVARHFSCKYLDSAQLMPSVLRCQTRTTYPSCLVKWFLKVAFGFGKMCCRYLIMTRRSVNVWLVGIVLVHLALSGVLFYRRELASHRKRFMMKLEKNQRHLIHLNSLKSML